MRTTVALDDDLVRIAQELTGVVEKTALLREALKALIERESARRLASLGGTMPELKNIPRRRMRANWFRRYLYLDRPPPFDKQGNAHAS
jgi:Arc/MetJ family transcription regulator